MQLYQSNRLQTFLTLTFYVSTFHNPNVTLLIRDLIYAQAIPLKQQQFASAKFSGSHDCMTRVNEYSQLFHDVHS